MNTRKYFDGKRYEVIAWGLGHEVVKYKSFGWCEGEWLLVSRDAKNYYVFKGWYGSCEFCDSFDRAFGARDPQMTKGVVEVFANKYKPFAVIPIASMMRLCLAGRFVEVLPRNMRIHGAPSGLAEFARDVETKVRSGIFVDEYVSEDKGSCHE